MKRKGFTLAEVLLTLMIVGIIASTTIPAMIKSYNTSIYKLKYKTAFSDASQVWTRALADEAVTYRAGWGDQAANDANFEAFRIRIKSIKICNSNNSNECWNMNGEKFYGNPRNEDTTFIDPKGRVWAKEENGGSICVDTNGFDGPNQFGKDRFPLYLLIDNDLSHWTYPGIPVKISPIRDRIAPDLDSCPSGECYYMSWLTGEN